MELTLGLLLIAGAWLRYASTPQARFSRCFSRSCFTVAIGAGIDCGCFGVGEALSWKTLARDGLLLAGAVVLARVEEDSPKRDLILSGESGMLVVDFRAEPRA